MTSHITGPGLEGVGAVAEALRMLAETERLAVQMKHVGVPIMVLKGPHLQRRLLGSPAAYASQDVDLLVPRGSARAARRHLLTSGWTFSSANGRLWRLDRSAAYIGRGITLDLHWGLHADLLPASALTRIEQEMWRSKVEIAPNLYEPAIDALAAFLSVHIAPKLASDGKRALLAAATPMVGDWDAFWRLVGRKLAPAAEHSIAVSHGREAPAAMNLLELRYGVKRARLIAELRRGRFTALVRR